MRTFLRSQFKLLAIVSGLLLAVAGMAWADTTIADGDGVVPLANNDMAMGSVVCGVESSKTAPVFINRNGSAGSTNVFKDGSTVTVTVASVTGTGLSAQMAAANTITLPS